MGDGMLHGPAVWPVALNIFRPPRSTRGLPGVLGNLYAPRPAGRPYRCRLLYPKLPRADNQIADKGYGSDESRGAATAKKGAGAYWRLQLS